MLSDLLLFIEIAFWLSVGLLLATACLAVATLYVQRMVEASKRRRAITYDSWRHVLEGRKERSRFQNAPDPRDAFALLCAWCDLAQSDWSSGARERLRRIAYDSQLDQIARRFLRGRDPAAKIAGARALGFLAERSEAAALAGFASSPDRELAAAARTSLHALTNADGGG